MKMLRIILKHNPFAGILWCVFPIFMYANISHADTRYTYDFQYRLTTAVYDESVCVVYNYDVNGNRTKQTNTVDGQPIVPQWGSGMWGCFRWTQ